MIHVVVGTSHLSAILGYGGGTHSPSFERFHRLHTEFRQRLKPLLGQPILPPCSRDDLAKETVFEALRTFHDRASDCLRNPTPAELLLKLQREFQSFARRDYHYPAFEANLEDAYHYLRINAPCRHGSVRHDGHEVPIFLPDFSVAVRYFGFFAKPAIARRWAKERENVEKSISLLDALASHNDSQTALTLRQCLERLREALPKRDEFAPLFSAIDSAVTEGESGAVRQLDGLRRLLPEAVEWMKAQAHEEVDDTIGDLFQNRCLRIPVDLECHLCDSLQLVYDRVHSFCDPFRQRMAIFTSQLEQTTLTQPMQAFLKHVRKEPSSWWGELTAAEDRTEAQRDFAVIDAQLDQPNLTDAARKLINQWLRAQQDRAPERGAEETLVIDARVNGFVSHRSLHRARRKDHDVPVIAHHRLLAAQATRQGLGKPVISALFPIDLWREFDEPVQHFLLNAAQVVGAEKCRPIYPNLPSREEMEALRSAAIRAKVDWKYGLDPDDQASSLNPDDFDTTLRKLGLRSAVSQLARPRNIQNRIARDKCAFDWAEAIGEYESAIYGYSIEQSLHLQELLDLYPLHKRVLGLVEYVVLPKVKQRTLLQNGKLPDKAKGASGLWTVAFTGAEDKDKKGNVTKSYQPLSGGTLQPTWEVDGKKTTLETEGNWILHAQSHASSNPIDLAALLDGIVPRMSSAAEVAGVSVNLQPPTPQVHARQLAALADCSNHNAACMTLYLGKVALMLRNAVEHGTDRVMSGGLLLDTPGYWTECGGVLAWLDKAGTDVTWRSKPSLPATLPSAANAFLLTPASLQRCLVLLSLVMHAGFRHLGI